MAPVRAGIKQIDHTLDMNERRVEESERQSAGIAKRERQLGTAEYDALHSFIARHPRYDFENAQSRCNGESSVDEIRLVFVVDVFPLGGAGHGDGYSLPGEHLAVKLALHGEARTDQADAPHSRHRHRIPGSLHDADEGD